MFFVFSKVLNFILTPVVWIFSLLLYALLSKDQHRKKKALLISIVALYLFSNPFLYNVVMQRWEIPPKKYTELSHYDAAIVLGGILTYNPDFDRIRFAHGVDRLLQAIELYKKGVVKKIFFVGGSGDIRLKDMKEGIFVKRYLLTLGIPAEDFIIESESKNTRENALFAKEIIDKELPAGKFLLVTSGCHMRRATGCFNKVGIKTESYSTDIMSGPNYLIISFLIPDVGALENWTELIHEVVGYVVYRISGYI